jgi:hypothetical protein
VVARASCVSLRSRLKRYYACCRLNLVLLCCGSLGSRSSRPQQKREYTGIKVQAATRIGLFLLY